MPHRLRLLLTWLLFLALPLQGYAAATMLNCATLHASGVGSAPAIEHSVDEHPCHPHAAMAPVHGDATSTALAKAKCSACAACCVGMALPVSAVHFETLAPVQVPAPAMAAPPTEFISAGLERPPR